MSIVIDPALESGVENIKLTNRSSALVSKLLSLLFITSLLINLLPMMKFQMIYFVNSYYTKGIIIKH